jgi:LDH2 family malate/lactate/ureidoglycolate dehydrogenase
VSAGAATRQSHVVLAHGRLRDMMRDCFAGVGLAPADADAVADVLADANLRGVDSHGVERAPIYLSRIRRGLVHGTAAATITVDSGVLCRMDAAHALGPAISVVAVDRAVAMAGRHGMGLVAVGRSTHFGAAGYYARRAAAQGMIAFVASNAAGTMAPHGGAERFLGANPLAFGVPLGRHGEFVLDMSTSVAARGRIRRAEALGEPLPPGFAIDADGDPTTDPLAALAGCVLPVGGPKGSGLALAITLMTGMLAGADFDDEMDSMYADFERPQNVGHLFWAIDPARLGDPATARERVEALIDRLHAVRPASGVDEVIFAGERQARLARERLAHGIPVARIEVDRLAAAADECGLGELAAEIRSLAERAPTAAR